MIVLYLITLLVLGIYSYSQIDLNLTLLQTPWFLNFQNQMIQLGYFNRPLSTAIFLAITFFFFLFYILFSLRADKLTIKNIITLGLGIILLGLVSYPAFSHDIFNYIFDARILVYHHANPYTSTALMFPQDSWTRFMNWTHRTYPYGPVFLPISVLVYILGLNKFILTLFWFKALMAAAYVGSSYLIYKMAGKKGLVLFALNPLIIYEGIVAGHMDVVMLFLALAAVYYKSRILWLLSAGVKYVTILLWPRLALKWLVILAYAGAVAQIFSRELLPHYFIVPLGISALLPNNRLIMWSAIIISLVLLLLRYYPFLSTGVWWPIVPLSPG